VVELRDTEGKSCKFEVPPARSIFLVRPNLLAPLFNPMPRRDVQSDEAGWS
jgi:hypothetical protein